MTSAEGSPWGTVEIRFDAIHAYAQKRDVESVKREIESGVNVDFLNGLAENGDGGNSAVWFATQGPWPDGLEVARVLVEAGADINLICEHGRTPLHMAAAWGHLDVVQYLVSRGANTAIRDDLDMTPLMLCRTRVEGVSDKSRGDVVSYLESL